MKIATDSVIPSLTSKVNAPVNMAILFCLFYSKTTTSQSYFQQEVNYRIEVSLDDVKHELNAGETIEYINNSPHELSFIYMHLWPNAYKNNSTALAKQLRENKDLDLHYSKEKDRGYIDQLDFKVNDKRVKWEYDSTHIDICKIYLDEPLQSGETISISTPFHIKIPHSFSRLGHVQQQYQITQWYPKPAVYDINGWNQMPYLDQGEFYSEYGTYDVYITLPKNYKVGATGDLINGGKELEWLSRIADSTSLLKKISTTDSFPESDKETKTLHYHQDNVHDFAWFADKRYHVLKGEVELPHSKRKVTTWSMFTGSQAELWKKSIPYLNDAVYYYSLWNGDYPYNHVTAIDGALSAGGGMEYPNITVIGWSGDDFSLETTIMHEVGHNWFYGILGSNERMHAWMDEGINSFNELRYIRTKYPDAMLVHDTAQGFLSWLLDLQRYKHKTEYELLYLFNAAKNEDQPIELQAHRYTPLNYGGVVYSKTALAFDYLRAYLGEATFDKAMRRYFETWKFRHPQPTDLRKIFEEVSGKNLGWLFDEMIGTTKKLDYKITSPPVLLLAERGVTMKNTGQIEGPFSVCGIKNGVIVSTRWYEGFKGKKTIAFPAGDYDHLSIDCMGDMPEINRNNNILKTKGIFKKTEPLKLQLIGSLDRPDKTQLFFTPTAGWNNYNKLMLGLAFYNHVLLQKKFEYTIMPLYAIGNGGIAGYGDAFYFIMPRKGIFQRISIGGKAARYAYNDEPAIVNFNKIAPEVNFEFRKKDPRTSVEQKIKLRSITILKDAYIADITLYLPVNANRALSRINTAVNELSYQLNNNKTIDPFSIDIHLQQGEQMAKLSGSFNCSRMFRGRNKSIDVRLFSGIFLKGGTKEYDFRMSGYLGSQDYLYDHIFLGRTELPGNGKLSRQFAETDGAFKVYSPYGQTGHWLMALNIKCSIPKVPFIRLYGDAGAYPGGVLYNAGINISLVRNAFDIYCPVLMSEKIKNYILNNSVNYLETIRFSVNFNLANPFYQIKNFSLN